MRVTERAQRAVLYAKQEAGRLGHDRVGTEHLLLALLRDEECLAVATLGELDLAPETVRRRPRETAGQGQGAGDGVLPADHQALHAGTGPGRPRRCAWKATGSAPSTRCSAWPARVRVSPPGSSRNSAPACWSRRRRWRPSMRRGRSRAVPARPGPPLWEPPAGARLGRVVPLGQEFPPPGDQLVLLSLEVWSDWLELRYAVVYATPEPEGELPRPAVLGGCEVS